MKNRDIAEACSAHYGTDLVKEDLVLLDNTIMSDYQTCPRKFFLRHLCDIVPEEESIYLRFGTYMHESLSVLYETHNAMKAMEVWDSYKDNPMDEKRTAARGKEIVKGYALEFPREPFEILANELPFQVPIRDCFYLIGKLDLVVEWHQGIYGMDHKTTSQLGKYYFEQFTRSRQMLGYTHGLRTLYGHLDQLVHGMIINAIAVYKSKLKFERHIQAYGDHRLEEYLRYVHKLMKEIQKAVLKDDPTIFIPNTDACTLYGRCQYKNLCDSTRPKFELEHDYRIEPWDPREEHGLEVNTDEEDNNIS